MRASAAEVETLAMAMVSKFFFRASKISTPSPRASGRMLEPASTLRMSHLFAAAAAGDQADTGFDEAHVELGVGLTGGGVERDLDAAAEAHAVGRDDDGARAELDGLGHVLEGADGHLDLVPLLFLDGEEELHQVGADGEVGGVAGDDEGLEVVDDARSTGLRVWVMRQTMSSPRAFILECSSMAATPSPRSMTEAPGFFLTTPFAFLMTASEVTPSAATTGL